MSTGTLNIANADNENYTRQRVNFAPNVPLTERNFQIGTGVNVDSITRIHDEFVYKRLNGSKQDKEFSNFNRKALEESKKDFIMYTYEGTRHGFHNNSTPRYNEKQAKLAWERTIAFFKKHLS